MTNNLKRQQLWLLGVVMACAMTGQVHAALILTDTFDYADSTSLRVNWKDVIPGSPPDFNNTFAFADSSSGLISANAAQRPATLTNQTLMGLNGRSTYRELGTTVNTSFTLIAHVGMNAYSRTLQMGLGDASGAGYSFTWNGAQPTGSSGNGVFNIREQTAWAGAPTIGATISGNSNGISPPTRYPLPNPILGADGRVNYSTSSTFLGYSEIKLTWQSSTGALQLFQDGILMGSTTDPTYNSFTRVYVGGGNRAYVDLITLDVVPEPATASLLALSGLSLLGIRRRSTAL